MGTMGTVHHPSIHAHRLFALLAALALLSAQLVVLGTGSASAAPANPCSQQEGYDQYEEDVKEGTKGSFPLTDPDSGQEIGEIWWDNTIDTPEVGWEIDEEYAAYFTVEACAFGGADLVTGSGSSGTLTPINPGDQQADISNFAWRVVPLGNVEVSKTVEGEDPFLGEPGWEFTLACEGHDPVTFFLGDGGDFTSDSYPVGTDCTITENLDEALASTVETSHTIDGGEAVDGTEVDVTIVNDTIEVVFTNVVEEDEPEEGNVEVSKTVEGDDPYDGEDGWEFTLACEGHESVDFDLGDGGDFTSEDYPVGTVCTITETIDTEELPEGVDVTTTFTIDGGEPQDGTTADVTIVDGTTEVAFTNAIDEDEPVIEPEEGNVEVSKTVEGDDPYDGEDGWEFTLACEGHESVDFDLGDGGDFTSEDYPVGTVCTITENLDDELAEGIDTTYVIDDADPVEGTQAEITIVDGTTEVAFTNAIEDEAVLDLEPIESELEPETQPTVVADEDVRVLAEVDEKDVEVAAKVETLPRTGVEGAHMLLLGLLLTILGALALTLFPGRRGKPGNALNF
jgi:hypothetical protein